MGSDAGSAALLSRWLWQMERENPHLAAFLSAFALQQADARAAATGGVILYRLLASQAEADLMDREFR